MVEPAAMDAAGGVTVMLWMPTGGPCCVSSTLSPQAAVSVPYARTPANRSERDTLCIIPPKEWCVDNCEPNRFILHVHLLRLALLNEQPAVEYLIRRDVRG